MRCPASKCCSAEREFATCEETADAMWIGAATPCMRGRFQQGTVRLSWARLCGTHGYKIKRGIGERVRALEEESPVPRFVGTTKVKSNILHLIPSSFGNLARLTRYSTYNKVSLDPLDVGRDEPVGCRFCLKVCWERGFCVFDRGMGAVAYRSIPGCESAELACLRQSSGVTLTFASHV